MKIIGIVGGIASGKTYYSDILGEKGAAVFKADHEGHLALNTRTICKKVRQRWGNDIILPDGSIDRQKLAQIVFQPGEDSAMERLYLESLIFPAVRQSFDTFVENAEQQGCFYVVMDAAMLLEAGWDHLCDVILFVDTPEEVRLQRATSSRGWTEEEFHQREATQYSLKKKRKKADFIISGNLPPEKALETILALQKKF